MKKHDVPKQEVAPRLPIQLKLLLTIIAIGVFAVVFKAVGLI